jgi:hypothetical protein
MANFRARVWMTLIGVAVLSSIPVFVVAGSGGGMGVALGGMVLAVSIAALAAYFLVSSIAAHWISCPGISGRWPKAI